MPQLPLDAAMDVVAFLYVVAHSLPALQGSLPGSMWTRLLALHMHLLQHLLPSVPVSPQLCHNYLEFDAQ